MLDALGNAIVEGSIHEGELINPERLAEDFGVSRSVIRESLRTLSSMGMLEARPQVGTRVLPSSRWDLLNPQIVRWRGNSCAYVEQLRELLEFRLGVEASAARLATTRMPAHQIARLRECGLTMREAILADDVDAFFGADAIFHRILLEGSGNAIIARFADATDAVLLTRRRNSHGVADLTVECADHHISIADAIAAKDADAAERSVKKVIEISLDDFAHLD